jgi:hypothetical protein
MDVAITTLRGVFQSGQYYCSFAATETTDGESNNSRLNQGGPAHGSLLEQFAWQLSGEVEKNRFVVAQIYGRGDSKQGGGDLVIGVREGSHLYLMACRIQQDLQGLMQTLVRNPRQLATALCAFGLTNEQASRVNKEAEVVALDRRVQIREEEFDRNTIHGRGKEIEKSIRGDFVN